VVGRRCRAAPKFLSQGCSDVLNAIQAGALRLREEKSGQSGSSALPPLVAVSRCGRRAAARIKFWREPGFEQLRLGCSETSNSKIQTSENSRQPWEGEAPAEPKPFFSRRSKGKCLGLLRRLQPLQKRFIVPMNEGKAPAEPGPTEVHWQPRPVIGGLPKGRRFGFGDFGC
jgi:hypothetical protein